LLRLAAIKAEKIKPYAIAIFPEHERVCLRLDLSVDRFFAKHRIRFDPCVDRATTVYLLWALADQVYS
jgi:hypothetical protein